MAAEIFSLGHSNLSFERFVALLKGAGVTAVADVRSTPFSKRAYWFSQPEFAAELCKNTISYVFLGDELGGRPRASGLFRAGVADYAAMAETDAFRSGLDRLLRGRAKHRIAMVCSERDPLHCHRCLLVGRQLALRGVYTRHIHPDGSEETQREAEKRLLREEHLAEDDLLWPRAERISEAYARRNKQVAFSLNARVPSESQWPIAQ